MCARVHMTLHAVRVPCSSLSLKNGNSANACVTSGQCIFRFVNAEEMVAPWDGICFDIDVKIDDLDSSDADEDDDDDD